MNLRLILHGLVLVVLTSCGYVQSPNGRGAEGLEDDDPFADLSDSARHFATTVYPLVNSHCASCHSSIQAPFFAIPKDIQSSHDNIIESSLVSFSGLEASRLVTKLREVHNCWTSNCENDADVMLQAIRNWNDLREPEDQVDLLATAQQTVPSSVQINPCPANSFTLPTDMMEFDLDELEADVPEGAVLQVRICRFDNFSYQVSDPLIITDEALYVSGLHIYVNGIEARPGNSFTQIEREVEASLNGIRLYDHVGLPGNPTFSPLNLLVSVGLGLPEINGLPGGGPGVDKIHFVFDEIGVQ